MKRIRLQIGQGSSPLKTLRAKKILKRFLPLILVISILMIIAFYLSTSSTTSPVVNYIFTGTSLKSDDGMVNVLLLGMAGGKHDGATLTDTIVIASYNLKMDQVYLISIPRDLWLPSLQSKANAVYQIGLTQGDGLHLAKTIFGNVIGLPIHYGLRVDFSGFVKAVDTLGGIEVLVERSFDDYNYPIERKENDLCGYEEKEIDFGEDEANKLNIEPGKRKVFVSPDGKIATDSAEEDKGTKYFACRFEHISFHQGLIHMDGETALKYVRSRHGTNSEASDFARSKRQQKVLDVIGTKALSLETLFSPQKISELIKTFGQSLDTDISATDTLEFTRLLGSLKGTQNFVLDDSVLFHPDPQDYGGAYVLVSQDDDFSIIHDYVRKIVTGEINSDEATSAARPR